MQGPMNDAPKLSGVSARVGPCYRSTALCKVALSIAEPTWNLGCLAGLALGLWGRLETLDLFQTAAGGERGRLRGAGGLPVVAGGDETRTLLVALTVLRGFDDELERVFHVGVDKRNKSEARV
jgi:hypothetical protein